MKRIGKLWHLAVVASCLVGSPALADVAGRYDLPEGTPGFSMTIEVDDKGDIRGQMGGQPAYYLIIGESTYIVTKGPKGPFVARMDDMAVILGEMTARMGMDKMFANAPVPVLPKPVLVSLGKRTINGRTGVAFGESAKKGDKPFDELVISDDPRLVPLGGAFVRGFKSSTRFAGSMGRVFKQLSHGLEPELALFEKGAPLKLMTFTLTDVSFETIPAERFTLPSEPLTLDQLREQYAPFPEPPTLPKKAK